jgi:hypothetical protein
LTALLGNCIHQNGLASLGCPDQMVHNQVDPMFVSLAQSVVFHVDNIPQFNNSRCPNFWLKPKIASATPANAAWLSPAKACVL